MIDKPGIFNKIEGNIARDNESQKQSTVTLTPPNVITEEHAYFTSRNGFVVLHIEKLDGTIGF